MDLSRARLSASHAATADADVAVRLRVGREVEFLERASANFYVPLESARAAIREHTSFNLVDVEHALKVDIFVLGDEVLDRMQIERRVRVAIPGFDPEDLGSRRPKTKCFASFSGTWPVGHSPTDSGATSSRSFRCARARLDTDYLATTARAVGLEALLRQAIEQSLTT